LEDLREEVRQRLIADDQRRRAESELLRAIEYEQQRLGCDLHDSLGQKLTGLSLLAESLATSLRATLSDKAAVAGQIVGLAKDSVSQVRVLAKGLNPVGLNVGGLAASLTELAQTVEAHSGISCRCRFDEGSSVEEAAQAMHLYRIAQEAVNNAVRHSRAKHIWITLGNRGSTVSLEVGDDGVGMGGETQGRGMGMHTMKYRASAMNGTLEVYSKPNVGTVVRCAVPKAVPAPDEDAT
jgi:signal transduction histidine kinase